MYGGNEDGKTDQAALDPHLATRGVPRETFRAFRRKLIRETDVGTWSGTSSMPLPEDVSSGESSEELRRVWWKERLRGGSPTVNRDPRRAEIKIVDLFSGCGGLATGVRWACEAVGVRPVFELCLEVSDDAMKVYRNNLRPLRAISENLSNLVGYQRGLGRAEAALMEPRIEHPRFADLVGQVDVVIAGPPCEGNSNFNNKTRRRDSRNELYTAAVACAIALKAKAVIVENVVTVARAHHNVVERSLAMLEAADYHVDLCHGILEASAFGTAQDRRRHFLIASKAASIDMRSAFDELRCRPISVMEAIGDLVGVDSDEGFDTPSRLSPDNDRRVKYLIEHDLWDLPNEERPECHRNGHNYPSVYGRMYPDRPALTITTGFTSPGRGRFTHPTRARGLTPHEGARLQGFPDDFDFSGGRGSQSIGKISLAHLIGNAVPPQLGYAVGLGALSII